MDILNSFYKAAQAINKLNDTIIFVASTLPKEEIKSLYEDNCLYNLNSDLDYYCRIEEYHICAALKELIDERQN